jgi:hypothetical protein
VSASLPTLAKLKLNNNWAKLPLFNRKNWTRFSVYGSTVDRRRRAKDVAG